VYAVYYDSTKAVEDEGYRAIVISSGPHKGMGVVGAPITDEQVAAVRQIIDDMAGHFVQAVAGGRGMDLKKVRALADGRLWLAPRAKQNGLIDGITNKDFMNSVERTKQMSDEKDKADNLAAVEKARSEGAAEGSAKAVARMKELKAAFADDIAFAMEQFEKGATVETTKAAYCDVLAAKNKQLADENATLTKGTTDGQTKKVTGEKAVPFSSAEGDGTTEEAPTDFLGYVAQYQKEGLSKAKAVAKATRLHPAAHAAHLESRRKPVE